MTMRRASGSQPTLGEMLTEQVGGAADVAGGCSADHFDVMAFPVHLAASGGTWGCFGDGGEIGDGEPEVRIGLDCCDGAPFRSPSASAACCAWR